MSADQDGEEWANMVKNTVRRKWESVSVYFDSHLRLRVWGFGPCGEPLTPR